jgi:Mg2+/citrate symporter
MTNVDQHNKMRLGQWFAVAAFSTIALVAMTSNFDKIKDQKKEVKWAVSAVSIALTFSALAVFAHVLLKAKFVGTAMEGGLVRSLDS